MYLIINGSMYRYHGYGFAGTAQDIYNRIKIYPAKVDIPKWTAGLVFIEPTDLPNGFYRKRNKKLVRIPDQWVGRLPTPRTIRQRNSVSRRTRSGP
jgi:hypothetical protein